MKDFTLIGLLLVTAVIALLVAMSIPAVSKARQTAYGISCINNLKSMGWRIHFIHFIIPVELIFFTGICMRVERILPIYRKVPGTRLYGGVKVYKLKLKKWNDNDISFKIKN